MTSAPATEAAPTLRFVDADGHVLEPPSGLQEFADADFRDRVWHVEHDADGEWVVADGQRSAANVFSLAGVAGYSEDDKQAALAGRFTYSEVSHRAWDAKLRVACMDADGIDVSVLYPTQMLAIQGHPDLDFAVRSCRAYNDWLSAHCESEGTGRVLGVAVLPQQSVEETAAELRRVAGRPGIVGAFLRPNPTADWRPFSDPVYDPVWTAAADTDLALGFHPYLDAVLPGAARGLQIGMLRMQTPLRDQMPFEVGAAIPGMRSRIDNMAFAQAIANPVDMMTALTFVTMGGVCERFPSVRFVFLEANGGWIVPWLERLDHHAHEFPWDMPGLTMAPSAYFRRQCWISFDPDESALPLAATSPLCGADRIVWASDFPHPDAKYPGVTEQLASAMAPLSPEAQRMIAGENALRLYGIRV